jgi:hypothetical protein
MDNQSDPGRPNRRTFGKNAPTGSTSHRSLSYVLYSADRQ